MGDTVRAHVIIFGRVQGVCFRIETQQAAQQLGLSGWVKNRSNGTVEAVFEGDQGSVDQMLRWCRQGPPLSKVNHVDIHWEPYGDTSEVFKITY